MSVDRIGDRASGVRCAIYTRKSSEEGLEQPFNSLDAQRDACEAYVLSQREEGWRALPTRYDDGGYSGGSVDRPALKMLLADIEAGLVDLVVVYKVDRLTRSLVDFARIVDTFDAKGVAFVSVTQAFNTTTSMGRLTLNVLLSFAQFEREVTGERIRDKIAASKRRGLWMGGSVPIGYDRINKELVVHPAEAETVREIFRRYSALGSVSELSKELNRLGIRSKRRTSKSGRVSGGVPFERGALYDLLQNHVYLGEISHRGESYPGEHEAIVTRDLWDAVQTRLAEGVAAKRVGANSKNPSLLAGLVYDPTGERLTPTHTVKDGRRYRYYVTQAALLPGSSRGTDRRRIPAHDLEELVSARIRQFLLDANVLSESLRTTEIEAPIQQSLHAEGKRRADGWGQTPTIDTRRFLLAVISRVTVKDDGIEIVLSRRRLMDALLATDLSTRTQPAAATENSIDGIRLDIETRLGRKGNELRLVLTGSGSDGPTTEPDIPMLKAVARARDWYEKLTSGEVDSLHTIARQLGVGKRYVARIFQCAVLAPDIVEAILDGRQPPELTLERLRHPLPIAWAEQRRVLGFAKS